MENFITLTLFAIFWLTFCKVTVVIYDKICYYLLNYLIKKGNEKDQKKISKLLGV